MFGLEKVRYVRTTADPAALEACAAEVAFVGRSNVGKSSVLNAVCGRKDLAHTSQVPGKTRTINVYAAGHGSCIIDLPGYGFAVGPEAERMRWQEMIEGYLLDRSSLQMIFMLVDANVGPTALDGQMAAWLQCNDLPYRIVANKCDKIAPSKQAARREEVAKALSVVPEYIFWVSALKGTGISALCRAVAEALTLVPPQKPSHR